jgi:hypothetical protein
MSIPSRIEIAGQEITVKQVRDLYDRDGVYGDWCSRTNTIRIQKPGAAHPLDTIFGTYYHEVLHAVLDLAGHTEWSKNEDFVERVGQLLYQAEKSRRYD